ncbi:MAG: sulfite exporter TauE/SafE family protein [Chloroflexi bacterium]|nr:sulfite exporter TauE/SafE family protein [Chloroflexota bacterium]
MSEDILLSVCIFAASVLYASVGQAGGSGYLTVMALFGVAPEVMRPTALVLNILVAGIAAIRFYLAGHLSVTILWPLLLGSIPLAIVGGGLHLPSAIYNPIIGVVLLLSAIALVRSSLGKSQRASPRTAPIPVPLAILVGAGIGLLAGLTGTGGGIFLSPFLLLFGWSSARETAATSTVFIFANSVAALAANLLVVRSLPGAMPLWGGAVLVGGLIGGELGSRWLPTTVLLRLLAVVLTAAGLKLLLT